MSLVVETHEFDSLNDLMHRRAEEMIPECVREGKDRAASFAAAGGRDHRKAGARHYTTRRRVLRQKQATPAQEARMINNSVYQHVFGFFNAW